MGNIIIWLVIMIPCSLLFTGIGIYAIRREKPMWICYSLVMWVSAFLGAFSMAAAGIVLFVGGLAGLPILVASYNRIYKKYKKK